MKKEQSSEPGTLNLKIKKCVNKCAHKFGHCQSLTM